MEVRIEAYPHLAGYAKQGIKAGVGEAEKMMQGDEETGTELTTTGGKYFPKVSTLLHTSIT